MKPSVHILYQDEHLIAVDKPSGAPVHPGTRGAGPAMLGAVRDAVGRWVYPVHRLDRATSGVLIFGFDGEIAGCLNGALARGEIDKRYIALVRGVAPAVAEIDHALPRDDGPRVAASTTIRRLWAHGRYSLVEARPHTGRRHQIRRHLKHLNHPLIGDVRYGKGEHNRFVRTHYGLHRLALHAMSLSMRHPVSNTPLVIRAPLPLDLLMPLLRMGAPLTCLIDDGACEVPPDSVG